MVLTSLGRRLSPTIETPLTLKNYSFPFTRFQKVYSE